MTNSSSENDSFSILVCNPFLNNESSSYDVHQCYGYFAKKSLTATILEILLGLGTVVANVFTFFLILTRNRKKFVFDKILMAHTIVDFVVGGIDLPVYHIFTTFGYWPFSNVFCVLWNTLDSSINTIGMLHMVYMSYARVRSIQNPQNYNKEIIIKHTGLVCLSIWILGVFIWAPINYFYMKDSLTTGYCYIPYRPEYVQFIITFFTWFTPLSISLIGAAYIQHYLHHKTAIKSKIKPSNQSRMSVSLHTEPNQTDESALQSNGLQRRAKLALNSAEKKLSVIMIVYLAQWLPSCIIWMVESLCSCVPEAVSTITYWLTFSVSFTDPVVVLLLNPNYSTKHNQN